MPESIIYLNGSFIPLSKATISPQERGMLFADGVYEVVTYHHGKPFAMEQHQQRLERSLKGVRLEGAADVKELGKISDQLVEKNNLSSANVYWQITRGGSVPRSHPFPQPAAPTVLIMASPVKDSQKKRDSPNQISAIIAEDRRWRDCWIKSLMLLPNVLAKQDALDKGAYEAILQRDGTVTEGTSANVFMVKQGELFTHPTNGAILGGITRQLLIELAQKNGYAVHQQAFTTDQLLSADEVFICGTTTNVTAITSIDSKQIKDGRAGGVSRDLYNILMAEMER